MNDYDYSEKIMTAYERRQYNSKKIAQLQYPAEGYEHSKGKDWYSKDYERLKEKHKKFEREMEQMPWKEPNKKPTWTPLDQKQEDELWDE